MYKRQVYENSKTLRAVPYDVPQIGFGNDNVNNLRLWDVEIPEEYELDYPTIEARRRVQDITAIPVSYTHLQTSKQLVKLMQNKRLNGNCLRMPKL